MHELKKKMTFIVQSARYHSFDAFWYHLGANIHIIGYMGKYSPFFELKLDTNVITKNCASVRQKIFSCVVGWTRVEAMG